MYAILLGFVPLLIASAVGSPECPAQESPWFHIPHETDCSKFYICAHGVPLLQTCPDGTHFNANHMVCQNPNLAGCESSFPELCPDWSMLPRPHPESCSKFIVCVHGEVQIFDCPQGLEFNADRWECVWPAESNCIISQAVLEDSQTDASQEESVQDGGPRDAQDGGSQDGGCKQGDLTPHNECSKYYVCDNGVQIAMDCPPGLLWNSKQSFCDWPASAGCE